MRIKTTDLKDMADEQEDLKEESEEGSDSAGQESKTEEAETEESSSEERQEESSKGEDSIETLLAKNKKLEEERDNYKRGLLAAKSKDRSLSSQPVKKEESKTADVSEEKIKSVLYRENERRVLRDTIDSRSPNFIKELVDDEKYREIIGYLPQNMDKSSEASIVKALKVAVHAWKFDRGIKDDVRTDDKEKEVVSDLTSSRTSNTGVITKSTPASNQKNGRKILKRPTGMESWYK